MKGDSPPLDKYEHTLREGPYRIPNVPPSQLIDFILTTHPAYAKLVELGKQQDENIYTGMSTSQPLLFVESLS
jgi:hypothetical protein